MLTKHIYNPAPDTSPMYSELKPILERISYNLDILLSFKKSLDEFKERKRNYHLGLLKTNIEALEKKVLSLSSPHKKEIQEWTKTMDLNHPKSIEKAVEEIAGIIGDTLPQQVDPILPLSSLNLPAEIKADILADMREIEKCFQAKCYRSVAILCGRLLEVSLHRTYFDATGVDLLEKSPGIGLGKIIAKLNEKEVDLDPGLSQQIHLINQVRIFSVHVKQQAFTPNENQTKAMILYTFDILEKLFPK
jgi:hypothetical protein